MHDALMYLQLRTTKAACLSCLCPSVCNQMSYLLSLVARELEVSGASVSGAPAFWDKSCLSASPSLKTALQNA